MNRQQPHATMESEKNKVEKEEDKLDNHHDDPDCTVYKNWYKVLWRGWKKQVKRIANSEADAFSSSDESISNEKQMVIYKIQRKSIKTHATKRPSDSIRNKLDKHFVFGENLTFPCSEGVEVKIVTLEKVSYSKIAPATAVFSHLISPNQKILFWNHCEFIQRHSQLYLYDATKLMAHQPIQDLVHQHIQDSTSAHSILKFIWKSPYFWTWIIWDLIPNIIDKVHSEGKPGTKTAGHIADTKTASQIADTKYAGQIADTKYASQIRELRLLMEKHHLESRIVQTECDMSQEILKDIANETNKNINNIKELQEKTWQLEAYIEENRNLEKHKGRESPSLMPEQKLSMLSDDWINILPEEVRNKFINRSKSIHPEDSSAHLKLLVDITATSEKTGKKPVEDSSAHFKLLVDITATSEGIGEKPVETLLSPCIGRINSVFSKEPDLSIRPYEKSNCVHQQRVMGDLQSQADNHQTEHMDSQQSSAQIPVTEYAESMERTNQISNYQHYNQMQIFDNYGGYNIMDSFAFGGNCCLRNPFQHDTQALINRNNEEKKDTLGDKGENEEVEEEEVAENFQENDENLATSKQFDTFTTKDLMLVENRNNEEKEDTLGDEENEEVADNFKENDENPATSKQLDTFTTKDLMQVENIMYHCIQSSKFADKHALPTIEVPDLVKYAAADKRSKQESTMIKLYRNVIQNETCRMMTSIDIVVSEAEHLLGVERTRIFFDLLDEELFHFESAGAISNFVPNMAESDVRQHVISFFEHACDIMNRLMTLLLSCPDSKLLQQMQEQNIISLMQSVLDSSLKSEAKEGKCEYSKETRLIMVDSEEFQRAIGDEIPEEVLDRLRHGDELVVHRFVDTGIERTQASERRDNRHIHYIYFPSACRLFIYIPTEKGSYWHQLDLQRVNRIN